MSLIYKCDFCLNVIDGDLEQFSYDALRNHCNLPPVAVCELCQRKHSLAELKQKVLLESKARIEE